MMKTAIFISMMALWVLCGCARQQALPDVPWRAIVAKKQASSVLRWKGDVKVKLFGAFTHDDSVMMAHSLAFFNGICQTANFAITEKERGDVEIYFVENIDEVASKYFPFSDHKQTSISTYSHDKGIISSYDLSIPKFVNSDSTSQNRLTYKMADVLLPGFRDFVYDSTGVLVSAYRPLSDIQALTNNVEELNKFDLLMLQTVYAPDFESLLPIALKQFGLSFYWVPENAELLMIFPLVIGLFLFAGLTILFYRKWGIKINNRLLRFNAVSFIALVMFGIMVYLYSGLSYMVETSTFHFTKPIVLGLFVMVSLIIGLPALNLFRVIELAINRKTHHKYFRSLMLFLSTSLIPSIAMAIFTYVVYVDTMNREGFHRLIIGFLVFMVIGIIRALISFFILKEKEIKIENDLQLSRLRELKTKAELNALHSKINPHFLYNSLNSIAGLAKTDADKTEQMALLLSKLFRYSINKEQSDWSTLAEEMEMVQIYLEIEKVRFDDRLVFSIDLPDNLKPVRVPRFMIQPLVENAIKHGTSQLVGQGRVDIIIRQNACWLEIAVSDNGPDFPAELFPGFGLQGVYDKLEILYPNRFELHFTHAPQKQILIKLKDDDQL
jgi:sensor histidine kinase YesM